MTNLENQILKGSLSLDKNDPVCKYFDILQQIMIFDCYDKKPYLNTTQNEQYMRNLIDENINKAFVVMGGSDPIFQLLAHDVLDIEAVDINEMQNLIFNLKKAAIRTLNNSEYESFFIDKDGIRFFSKDVFDYVKDGFKKEEKLEKNFWDLFFKTTDIDEIKQYFFKGGIESVPIDIARNSILFIKKKNLYYKIRENLEKSKIVVTTGDAVEYLTEESSEKYDYIDITNILLFVYQQKSKEEFKDYIKKIKLIYENSLKNNGTFILDYMFGIDINGLTKEYMTNNVEDKFEYIYKEIYKLLFEYFNISTLSVKSISNATTLNGFSDTIIYTKKKNM